MLRPGGELVTLPPVPAGYVLRQLKNGEQAAYEELFHLAWSQDVEFNYTLDDALDGGFFVVEHENTGLLVSSCAAVQAKYSRRHTNTGALGWLVTDPDHTGLGLGSLVAAAVTNRLIEEGYERPFLSTEDPRLTAISIYLRLGWRPYPYNEAMIQRWHAAFERLGREFDPATAAWN